MKKRIITKNLEEFISLVQIIAKKSLSRLNLGNDKKRGGGDDGKGVIELY